MRVSIVIGLALLGGLSLAAAAPEDTSLPEGPGKTQVSNACTACHAITQFTSQRHTSTEWSGLVDQMIAKGAEVSETDYPVIVAYLAKNYPATAGAAASAGSAGTSPAPAKTSMALPAARSVLVQTATTAAVPAPTAVANRCPAAAPARSTAKRPTVVAACVRTASRRTTR